MSRRPRDNQRSRVYAWERKIAGYHRPPTWKTIDEVIAFAKPIWRSERGRYGLAGAAAPLFESSSWGQTRAKAYEDHRITLPLWARQEPVVLHEMAHRLTPRDEAHGPRFVGVLIGLLARHAGYDADDLMALAEEMGVKYSVKSVGAVPVIARTLPERLEKLLPIRYMAAAVELDVSYRQVYGAALPLIRSGKARWAGKTLVRLGAPRPDGGRQ